MKESKRDKFVRLAENRTNSVIDRIRVLSNCANPYAYEYTDNDVREVFSAIEAELKKARARFQNGTASGDMEFRLSTKSHPATPSHDASVMEGPTT